MKEKILAKFIVNYNLEYIVPVALDMLHEYGGFSLSVKDDSDAWAGVTVEVKALEYDSDAEDEVVLSFDYFETDGADEEADLTIEIMSSAAYAIASTILDE